MFWKNLCMLCNKHNTTPNTVCRELGLSSATATHWRQGAIPRDTTLKKIADYFGITPEELLRDPSDKVAATAEPAPTSPLSTKFNDLLGQMTLQDLIELQQIMEEKIRNRK